MKSSLNYLPSQLDSLPLPCHVCEMVALLAVVIVTVIQENRDVEGSLSRIPLAYLLKSLVRLKDLL